MTWKIEFEKHAFKELQKLDAVVAKRIVKFLTRIERLEDPRSVGEALKGSTLGAFWKYRVGDFRIICDINDQKITVLVVRIGNRRDVYK